MPTQALLTEAFKIQQAKTIVLLEIEISDSVTLRFAGNETNVNWFTYSNNSWQAAVYTANPIQIDVIGNQNVEGRFESQNIKISNVDKSIGDYIRQNDIRGNKVFINQVLEGLTSDADDRVCRWKYRITNASAPKQDAIITVQSYFAETMSEVPLHIRGKGECGWEYDADGTDPLAAETCGWWTKFKNVGGSLDLTLYPSAVEGSCDKGIDTPNGCRAHFPKTSSLNPNLRIQAYPGIPLKPIERFIA